LLQDLEWKDRNSKIAEGTWTLEDADIAGPHHSAGLGYILIRTRITLSPRRKPRITRSEYS
jgi:hypothetical protein